MRGRRAARAYRAHRATPALRPPRPGRLTTHNRTPDAGIRRLPAQTGVRSRVKTNIQVPNTVGVSRRRAVKDMSARNIGENGVQKNGVQVTSDQLAPVISVRHPAGDRKAPAIRPRRATRPPRPFPFDIMRRGPWVQPGQSRVQPPRPLRAKPRLSRLRRPAPLYQPCRQRRRLPRHPRLRRPRRPRLRRRRRRHNSPGDRTRRSPATRRMPREILGMPAAVALPGGMQPRSRSTQVPSPPWPRSRSRPHTPRGRGLRGERHMARQRPAGARRRS
jgi:hypothetical protein